MFHWKGLGILFVVLAPHSLGQDSLAVKAEASAASAPAKHALREVDQASFGVGERLVFDVGYAFFTAGEAILSIPKKDSLFGNEVYHVVVSVNSTASFSWIYRVEDRYETFLDVKGIFPWRFVQKIREGKFKRDFEAYFDQANHVAWTSEGVFPVPPFVHDVVSALYYARTLDYSDFAVGQRLTLNNFYKDSTYKLEVKYLGRQRVTVKAGTFDTIIIEPLVREGGLFKSEGRVLIWITDDERKIPVKVTSKIVIGSIEAELREFSGIAGPIRAQVP